LPPRGTRANAPAMDWSDTAAPTLDDLELLARDSFAGLPEAFRNLCGELVFMVQDFPDEEVLDAMELETAFDILGLFQGADLAARQGGSHAPEPTMIFLYRRPILDYWSEHAETLGHIVRHVLIHEIGHQFGLSDEAMEAIEERE
jgi:predicted Zn-dependent protease with MMP-like domain